MRFWDSSAVVPLLCQEQESAAMLELYSGDGVVLVWLLTGTEAISALCRRYREGALTRKQYLESRRRLSDLQSDWHEYVNVLRARERAERLLQTHSLSAADALQLAAALAAVEEKPAGFGFVTLDARLAVAAEKEGFTLLGLPER
jgi:predicted nucleic acid-binding protein